jgi:type IV pilus assembly protein PilM
VHLAHTYLMSNFENCLEREECTTAYENIAVELMRALNFYRFSNPDSDLSDLWLCGGGAVIRPLTDMIGEMLDINLHPASELVPGGAGIEECNSYAQAIGITMQ